MKKFNLLVLICILIFGALSCSNDNILTTSNSAESVANVTINFSVARSWTPSLYKVSATNLSTKEVTNLPDSTDGKIDCKLDEGSYLLVGSVYDENGTLVYKGKTEVQITSGKIDIDILAFKNSGSYNINVSDYAKNYKTYDKVRATATRSSFQDEIIDVSDFSEGLVFSSLAAGQWNFAVSLVSGTTVTELDTFQAEVIADIQTAITRKAPTTTVAPSTTIPSSTSSTSPLAVASTTTTSSTTTTTTIGFDGYRVYIYGDNWSSHSAYYYNSTLIKVGDWPGKTMTENDDCYSCDLTESWVAAGTTKIIFYGGNNSNRYPADQEEGLVLPEGVRQAWFNVSTKKWETVNPFSTEPVITISPSDGATFTSSVNVSITTKNCTTAKYTTDGTDPKSSTTAKTFSNSTNVTVGSSIAVNGTVMVWVYGTDGTNEIRSYSILTKVAKSATPTRLGAYYTSSATSFSIWSPDSSNVKVEVKKQGESSFTSYTCTANFAVDGGYSDNAHIYGVTVSGDCHLAEYQFKIDGVAVRDPYGVMVKYENANAKTNPIKENYTENSCTISSYAGSSINIVVDMDKTEPTNGWADRPTLDSRCDSIVYEVHVGDFTSSSTWGGSTSYAGKFPGMVQSGTTYTSGSTTVKTGLDHLKELGITHVQIMPMYDYATKYNQTVGGYYNWGYDPVNYNVPEDRFSTCPDDYVARIKEVKEMINEFHKNGIRVVMDVVYNHTFDKEMFKNISTKYYTATDLSGCGNSIDTSNLMVCRMIRDSLEFWADEYNIDGFRFDLLGIYHTSAVKEWGEYMNSTFSGRNILMYGEPWNGYAADNEAVKVRMSAVSGMSSGHIGVFNGKYRETIKGSSDKAEKGYMFNTNFDGDGTPWNISVGLRGSGTSLGSDSNGYWTRYFTATPDQSVNYITAHDNLCLYDKIVTAGVTSAAYQQAIVKFGHGILLVSQGIPFIHCGDEFLRTKKVGKWASEAHNSYMYGQELNQIDWATKATNYSLFKYHKDLIELRKAHDGLRYRNGVGTSSVSGQVVTYSVTDTDGTKLNIVVNPGDTINKSGLGTQIFNKTGAVTSSSTECEGTGVIIFKQ